MIIYHSLNQPLINNIKIAVNLSIIQIYGNILKSSLENLQK
jgi:hypothetical protein